MNMSDLGTYIKNAITTKINALLPSQSDNSGKYLTTNGTSLSWGSIGSSTPIVNTSLTSLTIDCSIADIFILPITANSTFVLTNVTASKQFIVKNTSAGSINISLPNGQVFDMATIPIASGKARRFIVEYINSNFYWDYSKELVNA